MIKMLDSQRTEEQQDWADFIAGLITAQVLFGPAPSDVMEGFPRQSQSDQGTSRY